MKIKLRVWIAALVLLFTQGDSFAQYATFNGKKPIVVDEDEIRNITVGGNIDVVLRNNPKPGTVVKMETKAAGQLKASVISGDLFLESTAGSNERVVLYIWSDELQNLTLKDNTYAVSIGILDFKDLQVTIEDKARVAIRNADKIRFNAPQDRPVISNEKYFSVISSDR